MLRFNTLNRVKYNVLTKMRYNTDYTGRLKELLTRLGPRPIVLDGDMRQLAILENSFDVVLEQEAGGMDELTFSLPMEDGNRSLISNEGHIQMFDTVYVIREIVDRKKSRITEVFAEALWYDLQYSEILTVTEWGSVPAGVVMADVLDGTGWKVGTVEIASRRTLKVDVSTNRLGVLSEVESLYNGELQFDTQAKTVGLLQPTGKEIGASIMYDKNADDIEAYYDTRDLITRIYAYGKNGLSIEDANDGIPYVEDYSYTNRLRVRTIKDERFTNPYHLKEVVETALQTMARPRASYTIKMAELSNRAGLEHEKFAIGGVVRIYDKELGLNLTTRIMKWKYNVIEPYRTELTLETKAKTLSDLLTGVDGSGDTFSSSEGVDKADMLDLSVYNYLLNSRADDGMAYWESNGWDIDPVNGSSGGASFKTTGELGKVKELYQTVYPSNHDNYAISFKAFTQGLKVGENGRVGVEVTVKYEDGSEDTKFISLAR